VSESLEPIDAAILAHYAEGREATRLQRNPLELVRTQELLARHLPPPPATILDVGGGTGVYAVWLAANGYDVHLVDASPLHVEEARQASIAQPDHPLRSAYVGDARALDQPSGSVDAVLLLGPLYHLTERSDRLRALREANRVVGPGGLVFAVGISRFASLLDGLQNNLLDDPAFRSIVERDLKDGQHRPPPDRSEYFTTAYFHHPDELQAEVRDAGLSIIETAAIEGPAWVSRDFAAWWSNDERRSRLLDAIRAVENEPSLFGVSAHLMVVARKMADGLVRA
jgi:ubiquinone/menaquinone biosynthesis C-methylase UbiE